MFSRWQMLGRYCVVVKNDTRAWHELENFALSGMCLILVAFDIARDLYSVDCRCQPWNDIIRELCASRWRTQDRFPCTISSHTFLNVYTLFITYTYTYMWKYLRTFDLLHCCADVFLSFADRTRDAFANNDWLPTYLYHDNKDAV